MAIVSPHSGRPVPPEEVVRRLKQIDPRLGLAWGETVDPKTDRLRDCWMLTMDWLPDDRRHQLVRDGLMPLDSCYDALAFLPFDCGVDEAYGYVVRTFRQMNDRDDVKAMLERVHTYNAENRKAVLKETMELAEDLFETNRLTLRPGSTKAISSPISQHKVETPAKKAKRLREYSEQ